MSLLIPARSHLRGALDQAALWRNPTRVLVRDGAGEFARDRELGRGAGERCAPGRAVGWFWGEGEAASLCFAIANQVRAMVTLGGHPSRCTASSTAQSAEEVEMAVEA
jgi:hypothetical protein